MAASPKYKIYTRDNKYVASVSRLELGGALMAFLGEGATIRYGHHTAVWTEGSENQPAAESYDFVVETALQRTRAGAQAPEKGR